MLYIKITNLHPKPYSRVSQHSGIKVPTTELIARRVYIHRISSKEVPKYLRIGSKENPNTTPRMQEPLPPLPLGVPETNKKKGFVTPILKFKFPSAKISKTINMLCKHGTTNVSRLTVFH